MASGTDNGPGQSPCCPAYRRHSRSKIGTADAVRPGLLATVRLVPKPRPPLATVTMNPILSESDCHGLGAGHWHGGIWHDQPPAGVAAALARAVTAEWLRMLPRRFAAARGSELRVTSTGSHGHGHDARRPGPGC